MNVSAKQRLKIKIFAGFPLTTELRIALNTSSEWKESSIMAPYSKESFKEVHHQKQDFLGVYLDSDRLTLNEMRTIEKHLIEKLLSFNDQIDSDHLHLNFFAQVFVV